MCRPLCITIVNFQSVENVLNSTFTSIISFPIINTIRTVMMMISPLHWYSNYYRDSKWVRVVSRLWYTVSRYTSLDRTSKGPLFWWSRFYVKNLGNFVTNGNVLIEFEGKTFLRTIDWVRLVLIFFPPSWVWVLPEIYLWEDQSISRLRDWHRSGTVEQGR